jgi:hypothetical protein
MLKIMTNQSEPVKGESTMIKCVKCGNLNEDEVKICVFCGALLDLTEHISTKGLDDADYEEGTPRWGSARFTPRTHLVLGIEGETRSLTYKAIDISELILGRSDAKPDETPQINLTEYGALEKGVSRKHAVINRKDGSLYLIDHKSANGTYLNGQKLVPLQERVLRDGDDVRLGHLMMRITFEQL